MTATNTDRTVWAAAAIHNFAHATGIQNEEPQLQLEDLLADLMHWADAHFINWDAAVTMAETHYSCEIEDDEDEEEDDADWRAEQQAEYDQFWPAPVELPLP